MSLSPGHKPPDKPPQSPARSGIELTTAPTQSELAKLAAAVSKGAKVSAAEAVAYALELWREAATALGSLQQKGEILRYDAAHSDILAWTQAQEKDVPRSGKFPKTLNDFFRIIIKGKTRADSQRKFHDWLRERWYRDEAKISEIIQSIESGDQTGGYFDESLWTAWGSSYSRHSQRQKSRIASANASKRNKSVPAPK